MKKICYFSSWLVICFFTLTFIGCANNQQNAASASANPAAKTYDSQDLSRTGKRTSGEALQAADPSVTARGGN
jgi:hypothetical protein